MPALPRTPIRQQTSLVLNPEQLELYARIDSSLPALIVQGRNDELKRQFLYAVLSLSAGLLSLLALIAAFVYLVMQGHTEAAAGLLGVGVLGLVGGFVRSRL